MKKKTIVIVALVILGLGLVVFLGTSVIPKALTTLSKASGSESERVNKSYLLGEKIMAKANGEDKCIVNVFVLNIKGLGVGGKTVTLSGIEDISPTSTISDKTGMAKFELGSKKPGQFEISAEVDGVPLPKTLKVTFVN
jgi:hypothetical protein